MATDRRKTDRLFAEWFWTDRWTHSRGFSLPMEARGLYREMLTQAWMRGAELPNDHAQIRRITGCSEKEWKRCWPLIETFWAVEKDVLVNATQVLVYCEAKEIADRAFVRGQKGGKARHARSTQAPAQAATQAAPEQSLCATQVQPSVSDSDQREIRKQSLSPIERVYGAQPVGRVTDAQKRAGRLREVLYPEWYALYRHGARLRINANPIEWEEAVTICQTWDDERIEKLARIVLTTDDDWISGTDRGFKIFALKASWADNRLRAVEASQAMV